MRRELDLVVAARRRARATSRRCASASRLATTGSSISSGSSLRARATRSRTSLAAARRRRGRARTRRVICETCSRLSEVTCFTPSMPFTWSSRTSVTEVSTTSGAAPGKTVVTDTIGGSIVGQLAVGAGAAGDPAEEHDHERHHGREHGPLDADLGDPQEPAPSRRGGARLAAGLIARRRRGRAAACGLRSPCGCRRRRCASPGGSPSVTSTRPRSRSPISIGTRSATSLAHAPDVGALAVEDHRRFRDRASRSRAARSRGRRSRTGPARSRWSGLATQALRIIRRVAGSSVGETKKTSPGKTSPGYGRTRSSSFTPVRANATPCSVMAKVSWSRSIASIRTSAVLSVMRSPGATRRAPTTPSKGAGSACGRARRAPGRRAPSPPTARPSRDPSAPRDAASRLTSCWVRSQTSCARSRLATASCSRGLLLVVAQPEEHGALLDRLPLLEEHRLDHAAGLGLQLDRVLGVELPAEGRGVAQELRLDLRAARP